LVSRLVPAIAADLLTSDKARRMLLSTLDKSQITQSPNPPITQQSPITNHQSSMSAPRPLDLLQGTLDLLILRTLDLGAMHGWGISQRIQQMSGEVLRVNQGSLYPALHRLESAGWISSEWGASENNRQAKFYSLTRAGQRQLRAETESWSRMTEAVGRVLGHSEVS
jgi:transcriptional regulator